MSILYAFLILSSLGLLLGFGLSLAEKKLASNKDEKLIALEAIMPGANCGGCGYAGCSGYAEAVYKNLAKPGLCQPGGEALSKKMSQLVGVEAIKEEKMVAHVMCAGDSTSVKKSFSYSGLEDCNALSLLFGGDEECKYGCLGLLSCAKVCPTGAIGKDEKGLIEVNREKCIGCGACQRVCPKGTIVLIPITAEYVVSCSNHDSGVKAKKVCSKACIGCKICEVKVESSPFVVESFLSHNDYTKDQKSAPEACQKCPQKCITRI